MAPPAKPIGSTNATSVDVDLWNSYSTGLCNLVFTGNKLNPKVETFHVVPIGTMGIPVGQNMPAGITNMGTYQIANPLLDINSPVFTPSNSGSYIDRQSRYLNAIQLKKNTNAGAWMRLQTATKRYADVQERLDQMRSKARPNFEADSDRPERMPFKLWVSRNYPQFDSLEAEVQQAAAARDMMMIEVYGPGAEELQRRIAKVGKALVQYEPYPSFNMIASTEQVAPNREDELDINYQTEFRPVYKIEGYADAAKQWASDSEKAITFSINTSRKSSTAWEDLGFSNTTVKIGTSYQFISARTTVHDVVKEESLSAEKLGADLSVKLRASKVRSFRVKAGDWDGDFVNLFKDVSLLNGFSLPPACAVSQVVMGYNVSLDITMNSDAAKLVSDLYSRATSAGGSVSIFGIPISPRAEHSKSNTPAYAIENNQNNFGSFSITCQDGGHPIVLGVVGRKLPAMGRQ